MSRILLVESDERVRQLFESAIKSEFRVHFFYARDAREAIRRLKEERFDLIITREVINQQRTGASLVNFKRKDPEIGSILVLGDEDFNHEGVVNLPIPYDHQDLISITHKMLAEAKVHPDKEDLPPYIEFELLFFKSMTETPVDLYLRMIKSDGAHYVKRYRKGDAMDEEVINKYLENGKIKSFYIESKDRFAFFNGVVQICFDYICQAKASEVHLNIDRHSENYKIIQSMVDTFGIEEETIRLCDQTIKKMIEHARTYKQLNDLLRHVLKSQGSYQYKHAYLILLFCGHSIPKLKMTSEKYHQIVLEKMAYVCFFHDICLLDEKLQKIANKIDFYQADLDEKEKELVERHANMAATLLQRYQGLPSGVDLIIKQHHGTSNGIGFTDYYKSDISQLSVLFIVLEEFVGEVLNFNRHKRGIVKILENMERQYESQNYLRVVEILKRSIVRKKKGDGEEVKKKAS